MSQKTEPQKVFNAFDLILFAWSKKWFLIIISVIAFIASIIISLMITPRFKSQVVLFPASSISIGKNLVETSSIQTDHRDVLSFGDEEEAERLLQILHSDQIRRYITEKYNLMDHYEIPSDAKYRYTKLDNKYKDNVKFRRTEFMSIEITVLDTDAQMAADMANDIAGYIDAAMHNMQQERAHEAYLIVEKEYQASQDEISRLNDSIQTIRQLGVIDYESQAAALNQAYIDAISRGQSAAARNIEKKLEVLTKYGGTYIALSKKLESEIERLGQLKAKFVSAKVNVEQEVPQIFIVDQAQMAEKKALPKRSIIVILSTFSTFAAALLFLLIKENIKARV